MFRKIITLLVLTIIAAASICFVTSPAAQALEGHENPEIADLAEQRALEQGYGHKVPVKVGGKTFTYNDVGGITYAIRQLAVNTGNEAVITSAANISGCHLLVMNGKWFTNISTSSNAEFYAAFPGHSVSDYNSAVKKAKNKINEIFAQICAERGLDERGYPKSASTPKPTVSPVTTPKPSETKAPVTTPKPTTKPAAAPAQQAETAPKPSKSVEPAAQPEKKAQNEQIKSVSAEANTAPESPSPSAEAGSVIAPAAAVQPQDEQATPPDSNPEANSSQSEKSKSDSPASMITLAASTVENTEDTVTIEMKVSDLPAGTASIKTPGGEVVRVNGAEPIRIKVRKADLNANGQVEIVTLDNEGTPLSAYMVQTETRPLSLGLLWLWIAIGVIAAGAVICAVILGKKKRPLKTE